ncbi:hypothetical protein [Geodermatophilus chilensis]|uniref:hypothetical protein n=1 Tax=Geodermatophilus chilensis TaxID=2035835 RepID=UPI0012FFDFB9|nr:hypothetical protein [Geodermatophilus chilensis]
MNDDLPNGIPEILAYLGQMAAGYNNHLKWNEVAKLKADLMNVRRRWLGVPVGDVAAHCRSLGMREEDVAQIVELVKKTQSGRRLVPQKSYRDFRFAPSVVDEPSGLTSREW